MFVRERSAASANETIVWEAYGRLGESTMLEAWRRTETDEDGSVYFSGRHDLKRQGWCLAEGSQLVYPILQIRYSGSDG